MIYSIRRLSTSCNCLYTFYLFSCIYSLSKCFWKIMEAFRWTESSLDSQYVGKLHHVFIMSLQKKEKCCDDACSVLFCSLPSFLCLLYISPLVTLRFLCSHLSQVEQHFSFFFSWLLSRFIGLPFHLKILELREYCLILVHCGLLSSFLSLI